MQRRMGGLCAVAASAVAIMVGGAQVPGQTSATAGPTDQSLPTKTGGSANVHLVAHVPLGGTFRTADADLEQELSRPYAYVAQTARPARLHDPRSQGSEQRQGALPLADRERRAARGAGGLRTKYFKLNGRYYVAVCTQFLQGTPDADLGAIIFDVTGLPDTTKVKEVARIRTPEMPGGFHNSVRVQAFGRPRAAIHDDDGPATPTSTTWRSCSLATRIRGSSARSRSRKATCGPRCCRDSPRSRSC